MAEAALDIGFMSVEEYLARENDGDWKHEFVNGAVYAMVGTSDRHNLIAGELYAALLAHLPPRCQPFVIDLKVQIRRGRDVRFYYPDVFVSCGASDRACETCSLLLACSQIAGHYLFHASVLPPRRGQRSGR